MHPGLEAHLVGLREWQDESTALGLFSTFRSEEDLSTQSKFSFWRSLILMTSSKHWLSNPDLFVLQEEDLYVAFQRRGATPLGLPYVLDRMLRNAELIPLDDFFVQTKPSLFSSLQHHLKWFFYAPLILTKSLIHASFFGEEEDEIPSRTKTPSEERFVLLHGVKVGSLAPTILVASCAYPFLVSS